MSNLSSFYPQPVIAGTTDGTFAEGDDARITGAATKERAPTFRQFVAECNAKLSEYGINPDLEETSTWLHTTNVAPFNYNTNCWLPPSTFDFSGVSLNQRNGALITERHVLFAGHYMPAIGETVSFLRPDNTVASSTVQKIIPFGRRVSTHKVVAVSDNKLLLDGIHSNANFAYVRKEGIIQTTECFALNGTGGYTGIELENNELELYVWGKTGGEPPPDPFVRHTVDSSYINANVVMGRGIADFVIIQLSSAISGCAIYPLLNPEFYKKPEFPPIAVSAFGEDTDMTIYGVICPQNTRKRVLAKKFNITAYPFTNKLGVNNINNEINTRTEFRRVSSFNINIGGLDLSGTGTGIGSEGVIGGDSGSPMFVIDKNNQLILFGLIIVPTAGHFIGPAVEGLREALCYASGLGGFNRSWWEGSAVYNPSVNTVPEVVEQSPFRFLMANSILDFDSHARNSAKEVAKGVRSPNLISNQGSLININAGTGAPSSEAANGSLYLRTDGDASTTLYVRAGGAWKPLSSYEA